MRNGEAAIQWRPAAAIVSLPLVVGILLPALYEALLRTMSAIQPTYTHDVLMRRALFVAFTPLLMLATTAARRAAPSWFSPPFRVTVATSILFFIFELSVQKLFDGEMTLFEVVNRHDMALAMTVVILTSLAASWQESEARQRALAKLETDVAVLNMRMLDAQLRPHFIFNALNGALGLLPSDPSTSRRVIHELREFLAYALDDATAPNVTLDTELALIRRYTAIEQLRFGGRLTVAYEIEDRARAGMVPRMLLQPIVENAIKHGLSTVGGGCVRVTAGLERSRLVITVEDRSAGAAGPTTRGRSGDREPLGMRNTEARLELAFGEDYELAAERVPHGGMRVTISIPFVPRTVTTQ